MRYSLEKHDNTRKRQSLLKKNSITDYRRQKMFNIIHLIANFFVIAGSVSFIVATYTSFVSAKLLSLKLNLPEMFGRLFLSFSEHVISTIIIFTLFGLISPIYFGVFAYYAKNDKSDRFSRYFYLVFIAVSLFVFAFFTYKIFWHHEFFDVLRHLHNERLYLFMFLFLLFLFATFVFIYHLIMKENFALLAYISAGQLIGLVVYPYLFVFSDPKAYSIQRWSLIIYILSVLLMPFFGWSIGILFDLIKNNKKLNKPQDHGAYTSILASAFFVVFIFYIVDMQITIMPQIILKQFGYELPFINIPDVLHIGKIGEADCLGPSVIYLWSNNRVSYFSCGGVVKNKEHVEIYGKIFHDKKFPDKSVIMDNNENNLNSYLKTSYHCALKKPLIKADERIDAHASINLVCLRTWEWTKSTKP